MGISIEKPKHMGVKSDPGRTRTCNYIPHHPRGANDEESQESTSIPYICVYFFYINNFYAGCTRVAPDHEDGKAICTLGPKC